MQGSVTGLALVLLGAHLACAVTQQDVVALAQRFITPQK